jgi:hypothetical protein
VHREEFRTPLGVRKSPKNEPAVHELWLWGFVILEKHAAVGMAPGVSMMAGLWLVFCADSMLDWLFRDGFSGAAWRVHCDKRGVWPCGRMRGHWPERSIGGLGVFG